MDFRNFGCDALKISLPIKAKKTLKGVKRGGWYMAKDCKHAKMKLVMHARVGN